jgi:hypothetical protein
MTATFSLWKAYTYACTLFALGLLLPEALPAQCPLTCHSQTHLSLGADGEALFTPSMGLANVVPACLPDYSVMLTDIHGQPVSNPVTCQLLGLNLTFKITHDPTGNHCWGQVLIEDKLAPALTCVGDTIVCNESFAIGDVGMIEATDNCDPEPTILLTFEEVRVLPCEDPHLYIREIERRWIARDAAGNESDVCTQLIFVRRATFGDIQFPPNRIGPQAIPCETPDIHPNVTGYPTVFGGPNDPLCKMAFAWEDDTLAVCAGAFTVIREWTAMDCCSQALITATQILEVADQVAPFIVCPADITLSTKEDTCTADVLLPIPSVSDNCSPGVELLIETSWGATGPGPHLDLPEGGYKVHYIAIDSCGNRDTCTIDLLIKDRVPPVALCRLPVTAWLDATGQGYVVTSQVDAGSFDLCSDVMGELKYMGESDSLYRDTLFFDCSFIGADTMVVLRVSDCLGNAALCMTTLLVLDSLPPALVCPSDINLLCTDIAGYPDIGGEAIASDNCTGFTLTRSDSLALDPCNVGAIVRTWTAADVFGNEVTCVQVISLADTTMPSVIWPADVTIDCSQPLDPSFAGSPEVMSACALLAVGHRDSIILVDNGCDTLYRIWRVADWCTGFDTSYVQKIDLLDAVPILDILCQEDVTVEIALQCQAFVALQPVEAFDECGHYILISHDSPFANAQGADASGVYPLGAHTVTFTLRDACSEVNCTKNILVRDTLAPLITCRPLTTCIEADSTFQLDPGDMIVSAFSPCGMVTLSADRTEFDCADIMVPIPVTITATDPFGQMKSCVDTLFLLDCGVCIDSLNGPVVQFSGRILQWDGQPIASAPVVVDFGPYQDLIYTDPQGYYKSPPYPPGISVTLSALPAPGDLTGLSTEDIIAIAAHLKAAQPFQIPEAFLAADVNASGHISISDIIALRRSILQQWSHHLAGNWRMSPAALLDMGLAGVDEPGFWEGCYHLSDITSALQHLDFIGVKGGDVSMSTKLHTDALRASELRYLDIAELPSQLVAGQSLVVQLRSEQLEQIAGLQLSLGYASQLLRLEAVTSEALPMFGDHHVHHDPQGIIRISWDQWLQPTTPGDRSLLCLHFTALEDAIDPELLWLRTQDLLSECYFTDEGKARLLLRYPRVSAPTGGPYLYPAVPNPFRASTTLAFDLDTEGPIWLAVYHPNGRLLLQEQGHYPAGHHRFYIDGRHLTGPGMYTVQLRTAQGVLVRQMAYVP